MVMSIRDYVRSVLTSPTSSCQCDLHEIGSPYQGGSVLYLVIDAAHPAGWFGRGVVPASVDPTQQVRNVSVVSRASRGEVRGYYWAGTRAFIRPTGGRHVWPEIDAVVAEGLGCTIDTGAR